MSREPILSVLGVLVIIAPFAGLPLSWLSVFLPVIGILILLIGVTLTVRKRDARLLTHADTPIDHA